MANFLGLRTIPEVNYHRPTGLDEALKLLMELQERAAIVAGGTDTIPAAHRIGSLSSCSDIVDISNIKDLGYVVKDDSLIRIGATTKLSLVSTSIVVQQYVPILADAVRQLGSLQIRNMGTIGGNLCNASSAADTAPPLLSLEATVKLQTVDGERIVPLNEFLTGPGKTSLTAGEMLTEVQIPVTGSVEDWYFIKLGRRNSFTLSIISVAALVTVKNGSFDSVRISLGAVAPTPMRARQAESELVGKSINEQIIDSAARLASSEVAPIDDVRATAEYRKDMAYVLTKRGILSSIAKSGTS